MAVLFDHYNAEYSHLRSPGTRPLDGPGQCCVDWDSRSG